MPPSQSQKPSSSDTACRANVAGVAKRPVGRAAGQPSHAGLLLTRYLTVPARNKDAQYPDVKKTLFDSAIAATANAQPFYARAFDRWKASLGPHADARIHADARTLAVQGRLVTGLGNASVLEAGIALHHTYGVPWIPGSGLKGLAAHYADRVWGDRAAEDVARVEDLSIMYRRRYKPPVGKHPPEDPDFSRYTKEQDAILGERHQLLFGTTESSGYVTFHDAWITPESLVGKDAQGRPQGLLRDVLTPHHREYYDDVNLGKTGADVRPPTDFDDPNPVSFLSVRGTFLVALSCDALAGDADGQQARQLVALAWKILEEALADRGAGGKTSSGYGRMTAAT